MNCSGHCMVDWRSAAAAVNWHTRDRSGKNSYGLPLMTLIKSLVKEPLRAINCLMVQKALCSV